MLISSHEATNFLPDFDIAQRAGDLLNRLYPGHPWLTHAKRGTLYIWHGMLSGQMGMVVHAHKNFSATDFDKRIMRDGGELLERYRQRRARIDFAAIANLPVDYAGRHRPEL